MANDAFSIVDWRFALCSGESRSDLFGPFSDLVALWQQRRADRGTALPLRSDIDFYDLTEWLGRVSIAKIERDPFALRFTLWGTLLSYWWGLEYTGKILGEEAKSPELWNLSEMSYFREMDQIFDIGIACGTLGQHGREGVKVLALDLPLGQDGQMTHVLSAHMLIDPESTFESMLPYLPARKWIP